MSQPRTLTAAFGYAGASRVSVSLYMSHTSPRVSGHFTRLRIFAELWLVAVERQQLAENVSSEMSAAQPYAAATATLRDWCASASRLGRAL